MMDCVIVGGGPAGLTAALYLARFLRAVTVFDAGQGRAAMIPATHNLAAFPEGISGRDLLDRMQVAVRAYGGVVEDATVRSVLRVGEGFVVATDGREVRARTVIFACGVTNHGPPLSEPDHLRGVAAGLIRYCPVCDAFEVRGQRVAVLGDTDHGLREAIFVRHYTPLVTLITPVAENGGDRDGICVPVAPLARLGLAENGVDVTLTDGETRRFDTIYVALGTTAKGELAERLGARMDEAGHIAVDAKQRTSVAGAYAIGDVTVGLDQIAVAMGQAAVAATDIHNSLR